MASKLTELRTKLSEENDAHLKRSGRLRSEIDDEFNRIRRAICDGTAESIPDSSTYNIFGVDWKVRFEDKVYAVSETFEYITSINEVEN